MLWCIRGDENSEGPFQYGLIHNGIPWPADHIQVLLTPLQDLGYPRIPAGDPRLSNPRHTPHTQPEGFTPKHTRIGGIHLYKPPVP